MLVKFEDKEYSFDLDELDVSQATTIKNRYHFTLLGLEQGLMTGDPDALRCIYWLMLWQNGERKNIDNVNFKVVKFAAALQEANAAEEARREEDPKDV